MKKVISFVLAMVLVLASTLTVSAAEAVADGYTRYEGEAGNIVGSNAPNGLGTDTGDQFSNGSAAGYLDVSRCKFEEIDATFSNVAHVELKVNAAAAGTAEVIVGYTCAEDADFIAVQANDGSPVKVALKAADAKTALSLDLKEGENTIYVSTTILDDAGAQHGWVNIDFLDVKNEVAAAATEETAATEPAEDASQDAAATDMPKTGEAVNYIPFLFAGVGCLLVAVVANKKVRKDILN
ncbi:MAG: hypothetical protein K0S47_355 [Herbinix sp.]|nr:hypothetical protein [Herbinix sp.]